LRITVFLKSWYHCHICWPTGPGFAVADWLAVEGGDGQDFLGR
jgi:hypothetical protein